jgi:voltage-gated potassium channel Kch
MQCLFKFAFRKQPLDRFYEYKNIFAGKMAFLTQNKPKKCKNLVITLFFEKYATIFAEIWQKSQKIVIINNIDPRFFPWYLAW